MESKDPTVFTKTYEEGVERVLKVKLDYKYIYVGLREGIIREKKDFL